MRKKQNRKAHRRAKAQGKRAIRQYKDSVFRMLFSDKRKLLALYNALSRSHYTDENKLEIRTLDNAIYMNIKNDLSFIIDTRLYLYEHQSTYSPNMPLRDLFYVADQLQELVNQEDIYRSTLIRIPTPGFVVFYNGIRELPDRMEFRLSDAFTVATEEPQLELKVTLLNVNAGHNPELMEQCKDLRDYASYVEKVRTYTKVMELEDAVERAVKECIQSDVLREFLTRQRSEAIKVTIYEFDQALHDRTLREEGREEGRKEGRGDLLREQIAKKLAKNKTAEEIADELEVPLDLVREGIAWIRQGN